jgi:hypothetical protein
MAEDKRPPTSKQPTPSDGQQQVRLNAANLKSTYCNMCNANTTREESYETRYGELK